jgi:hypothetical protein
MYIRVPMMVYSPLFDSLYQFCIKSVKWEILEIDADVPETANTIKYGIDLRDTNTVWLYAVQIEVLGSTPY